MTILEARRTRHLLVRLERGEELPAALVRALDEMEVKAGWLSGFGVMESMEIAVYQASSRGYGKTRRLDTPCSVTSLSGNIALYDGAASVRLFVSLAREGDFGLETFAGELAWARALSMEIHVVAFDDLTLGRSLDERTGLTILTDVRAAGAEPVRGPAVPSFVSQADAPVPPAMPVRPTKPREELEAYPEVGDLASHFHFGDCEVISSDGDRIRLRQQRDGRVREVSLTMLRIEPTGTDPQTGKHTFRLARKN
jgi:predicted DNA-binding protein with PD1-like motif